MSPSHQRMETDLISETCYQDFGILGEGQSPKNQVMLSNEVN
jgi:hypothetical protein